MKPPAAALCLWAVQGFLASGLHAAPLRGLLPVGEDPATSGRSQEVIWVKLREGLDLEPGPTGIRAGPATPTEYLDAVAALEEVLVGATLSPRFSREASWIRADRQACDPDGTLADLALHLRVIHPDGAGLTKRLRGNPLVEGAWLALLPVPPPEDIPPSTPDFSDEQGYLGPGPEGLGLQEASAWPGGDGANVAIADIEYAWDENHEDLGQVSLATTDGWEYDQYLFHGNSVLGQLFGEDNGYGVVGMAPGAEPLVVFPFASSNLTSYDVADAIDRAAALLEPGDVLLIEQQGLSEEGAYGPVEMDQGVFDAITLAVARGIVVVEPSGNGGLDLDDPSWGGAFDRQVRDSGAILVGGGQSPDAGDDARSWYPFGSAYGTRIDVQGWYDAIVTATSGEYGGAYADLYYPGRDGRQAYTESFGGTSGASPMVAAVAAILQSVSIETTGQAMDPMDVRSLLASLGTPGPAGDDHPIGPQPDLRRLLRAAMAP